ncbi:DgyrCDS5434 [Dimorphilus gyrociliatus]|uniref:Peroxisomal leader peptide-processing protease n=1 Tax=Dimorphilus gyrociliatus TaxID=2664684 RepID=A0A7I8VJV2_9ANNE|nr:DgyrCDS5434 [Dimorphilus gyrociliatus]
MEVRNYSCLIELLGESNVALPSSSSGILIDSRLGILLTHGTVLFEHLLHNNDNHRQLLKNQSVNLEKFNLRAKVSFEKFDKDNQKKRSTSHIQLFNCNQGSSVTPRDNHSAQVLQIFVCPEFVNGLNDVAPKHSDWSFNYIDDTSEKDQLIIDLLPTFVLLRIDNWRNEVENDLKISPIKLVREGLEVYSVATPFANLSPGVFLNSISRGIICKATGKHKSVLLTDARCVPGTEGGPLFDKQGRLIGLIASSLCWKGGEFTGLAIACSIQSLLRSLPLYRAITNIIREEDVEFSHDQQTFLVEKLSKSVVYVKCGALSGSGVVIEPQMGLIATCRHVVAQSAYNPTKVKLSDDCDWFETDVIFSTNSSSPYDFALLKVKHFVDLPLLPSVQVENNPFEGEELFMIGHALLEDKAKYSPIVSTGCLAKLVCQDSLPVMIQSTTVILPGASGGALFGKNGHLVGLIVSNSKDTENNVNYPQVNLSIPFVTLWPYIEAYKETKDMQHLELLNTANNLLKELWSLQSKG